MDLTTHSGNDIHLGVNSGNTAYLLTWISVPTAAANNAYIWTSLYAY